MLLFDESNWKKNFDESQKLWREIDKLLLTLEAFN